MLPEPQVSEASTLTSPSIWEGEKVPRGPHSKAAFSMSIPRHLARRHEHIKTKEMRVVEQVLLHWGRQWRGKQVIMHIDNQAVVHALDNQTIQGLQ